MKLPALLALFTLVTVPLTAAPERASYDWPTSSTTVLRNFDYLEHNWLSGHRGVDIAGTPGEEIRSAGPGIVAFAGRVVDNNVVSIDHPTGLRTTYLPVTARVEVGDSVVTGDVIGTLDDGHCLIGACLHWGLKRGDRYYDPLSLLEGTKVRLYPPSSAKHHNPQGHTVEVQAGRGSRAWVGLPEGVAEPVGRHVSVTLCCTE